MEKLPVWKFPHTKPAFRDLESVTVLEAIHILYGVINELIESYNVEIAGETQNAIDYMKTHLDESIVKLMEDLLQKGVIHETLVPVYDEENESLTLTLMITNGGE